jgi:hypothetical protein
MRSDEMVGATDSSAPEPHTVTFWHMVCPSIFLNLPHAHGWQTRSCAAVPSAVGSYPTGQVW